MNKVQIVFNSHVDKVSILDILTTSGSYEIEVVNNYNNEATNNFILDLDDLDSTGLNAMYNVLDNASFLIESAALIWKVERDGLDFDLTNSFIRDVTSTTGSLTAIPDNTQLKARFEIPGFETSNYREIDLWYNEDFNPTDLVLLREIGIELTGNGGAFTIANDTDCKVNFSKPSGVTDVYVIDDPNSATIIT